MKENNELISVLLPVYNAENYIEEAVQSVLDQIYTNFELLLLNDGSTDGSKEKIKKFEDDRIVYIEHSNMGLSKTLNKGIKLAKGKYIARMDADDICLPFRFEKQMRYLNKHKNVALLGGGIIVVDKDGQTLNYDSPFINSKIIKKILFTEKNTFYHPTVIFKKSVVQELGGYDEEINCYFEDYFLWAKIVKAGHKTNNLNMPLIKYRLTPNSITSAEQKMDFVEMMLRVVNSGVFTEKDKLLLVKRKAVNKNKDPMDVYNGMIKNRRLRVVDRLFNMLTIFLGKKYAFKVVTFVKMLWSMK
jgi:glycosyltransferase involved in cell wall biosynthesis